MSLSDRLETLLQVGGSAGQGLPEDLATHINSVYRARDARHPGLVALVEGVRVAEQAASRLLTEATAFVADVSAELQAYATRQ